MLRISWFYRCRIQVRLKRRNLWLNFFNEFFSWLCRASFCAGSGFFLWLDRWRFRWRFYGVMGVLTGCVVVDFVFFAGCLFIFPGNGFCLGMFFFGLIRTLSG